jgi:acetyl esterase/lipase
MADAIQTLFDELAAWAREHGPEPVRHDYGRLPDQHAMVYGDGPAAIVIHGGFWRARWREPIMAAVATSIAALGYQAWSIEYRRVGAGGGYPETLDDVAAAIRAAPDPAFAIGHSAGGHLALWAAAEGLVPAAVALAGVCDLQTGVRDGLGDGAVADFLKHEDHPDADPMRRLPIAARLLLVHGTDDDTVPITQSRELAAAAGCELLELSGAGHFDVVDPRTSHWQAIVGRMRTFLG